MNKDIVCVDRNDNETTKTKGPEVSESHTRLHEAPEALKAFERPIDDPGPPERAPEALEPLQNTQLSTASSTPYLHTQRR